MIYIVFFIALSCGLLAGLWLAVRGRAQAIANWDELPTEPVDVAAFRNLTDPEEDAWLKQELSQKDYLAARRERLGAAADYLARTNRNAAVLLKLGQAAMASPEAAVAAAGRELVNTAMLTRWYTMQALLRVRAARVLPVAPEPLAKALAQYQRLRDDVDRVGRLRSPVLAARIAASL